MKTGTYFLSLMLVLHIMLFIFQKDIFEKSMAQFFSIIIKIAPIFILVLVLMTIINHYVDNKFIKKRLKGKGIKKWIYAVVGGIISTGPIYMWYPFLAELKKKGLGNGLIACFLYNRAIKLPLLPVAIGYFGWIYVLTLTIVMVIVSVLQGLLLERLIRD